MKFKRTKSGLIIPAKKENYVNKRQKFLKQYYIEHKYCPKCYSSRHESTTMGCIQTDPKKYRDRNYSYCMDCDWKGRVHSRVPYNTYQGELEYYNKQYYNKHRFCPQCGNEEVSRTCVGSLRVSIVSPDTNKATCKCGWVGIVHDLVQ